MEIFLLLFIGYGAGLLQAWINKRINNKGE